MTQITILKVERNSFIKRVQRRKTPGPGGEIRDVFMEAATFSPGLRVAIGLGDM